MILLELPKTSEAATKVECAWCRKVLRFGLGPISHGICKQCTAKFKAPLASKEVA